MPRVGIGGGGDGDDLVGIGMNKRGIRLRKAWRKERGENIWRVGAARGRGTGDLKIRRVREDQRCIEEKKVLGEGEKVIERYEGMCVKST